VCWGPAVLWGEWAGNYDSLCGNSERLKSSLNRRRVRGGVGGGSHRGGGGGGVHPILA